MICTPSLVTCRMTPKKVTAGKKVEGLSDWPNFEKLFVKSGNGYISLFSHIYGRMTLILD